MAESNSYEEQRRRQMEENRRKLDELRLHHLSAAVREAAARPKPKPRPRPKRKAPEPGELRRSGRVAGLPEQPNYLKGAQQRDYQGMYADVIWKGPTDEQRAAAAAAKQKAEELQRRIHGICWPAFVKPMTHDCASRAAAMTIPKHFIQISRRTTRRSSWWMKMVTGSTCCTMPANWADTVTSARGGDGSPPTMTSPTAIAWFSSSQTGQSSRST